VKETEDAVERSLIVVAAAPDAKHWSDLLMLGCRPVAPKLRRVTSVRRNLDKILRRSSLAVVFVSTELTAPRWRRLLDHLAAETERGLQSILVRVDRSPLSGLPRALRDTVEIGDPLDSMSGWQAAEVIRQLAARVCGAKATFEDRGRRLSPDLQDHFDAVRQNYANPWAAHSQHHVAPPDITALVRIPRDLELEIIRLHSLAFLESQQGRFVNTWFEADRPVPPLTLGQWEVFCLDIGPREDEANAVPFAEPDFGVHHELELCVTLYSRELDIEHGTARIRLPRTGRSSVARTRVRAHVAGHCRLDIVLSLARELDILQTLSVEVRAQAQLAAIGATAP
jgi:hypothetical protein